MVIFARTVGAVADAPATFLKSWKRWYAKYPSEELLVRKQEHSSPLSFCANAGSGREKSRMLAKIEDGRAIVDGGSIAA